MNHAAEPDPLRPLKVASRWTFAVGIMLVTLSWVMALIFLVTFEWRRSDALIAVVSFGSGLTVYFVVGSLLIVCAKGMVRKKFIPLLVAMVISGLLFCLAGAWFGTNLLGTQHLSMGIISFAALGVFATMLWLQIRAYRALKIDPLIVQGFAPVMAQPVPQMLKDQ